VSDIVDSTVSDQRRTWLWDQQHALVCRIELSAIYHRKRERFLSHSQKFLQALTALTATFAFSELAKPVGIGPWAALVAAIGSVMPLVFGFSERARDHAQLAIEYRRLLAEVRKLGARLTETQLTEMNGRFASLEVTERASLGALVVDIQNEMAIAAGHSDRVVRLTWYQRTFMHFIDFHIQVKSQRSDEPGAAA